MGWHPFQRQRGLAGQVSGGGPCPFGATSEDRAVHGASPALTTGHALSLGLRRDVGEATDLEGYLEVFGEQPAEPEPAVMELNEGVIGELEAASGASFDELFLKEMSAHHSSAIDMAGIEIAGGEYEDTVAFAESIKTTQLEEIAEMQELMAALSG